ncbi:MULTISPECIES: SLBB domain-containing protein [unclassified Azospirillum]|uniref:polysaccharide biosynthesis/export family protein n=1 Tax=unclassified Azospirillum TaxID=2630922 RepID=UPI000B639664|nr:MULTISPECIES: SLBB domain-containing protein [unclassified Azospirillum]SNS69442.1 protein involved in polysaccharide export, contains SLBB domain of the beta-grasp fold [Azospirillum sp. RU38E]SNS87471.1 protein involved in polysaccharide export, contains SLBB domain of the beta-grasp fold [Azospirillum sp. RU37A]
MRHVFKAAVQGRHLRSGLAWVGLLVSAAMPASAQMIELPTGSVNLRDLQQQYSQGQQAGPVPNVLDRARQQQQQQQQGMALPFGRDEQKQEAPSTLEAQYQRRVSQDLVQFGYDLRTATGTTQTTGLLSGSVPDDYVLGVGDELVITLRGQVNNTTQVRVDREGRIVLPNMPPVAAAGRHFGEFRDDLTAQAQATFLQTNVYVSVGSIRSIGVLVTGEVRSPGRFTLTSLSSLVDALLLAEGVNKTGSLRNLKIVRAGETIPVDLYDVLLGRRSLHDLRLRDGDQIIVPGIGTTIAIAGDVVRPGIYELRADGGKVSLNAALELAGGPQRARGNRLEILRLDPSGRNQIIRNAAGTAAIAAGDVISVQLPREAIALEGGAELPGDRGLGQAKTLGDLLRDPYVLQSNPYLPFAVIETEDPVNRQRRYVPVDLQRVLEGSINVTLRERDKVIILTKDDVRYLGSADVQAVLRKESPPSLQLSVDTRIAQEKLALGGVPPTSTRKKDDNEPVVKGLVGAYTDKAAGTTRLIETDVACAGLRSLAVIVSEGVQQRFNVAHRIMSYGNSGLIDIRPCPVIYDRHPDLLPFLLEFAAVMEGEVRSPGIYPVVPGTRSQTMLSAVGGLTLDADANAIEMSSTGGGRRTGLNVAELNQATVNPGDVIRISARVQQRENGVVEVAGEVLRPGRYDIRRGEKLSELLRRVDGLTAGAYPYGAVFQREQVRIAEEEGYRRAARELEQALPGVLASGNAENAQAAQSALPFLQGLINSLKSTQAVGRVVIEADPTVLASRPELDFALEPGDKLLIPKRPSHVTVTGEVLNPSSVMFTSGSGARDYIKKAGGVTASAELSDAFVIYPNGESEPLGMGRFSNGNIPIPPGSTIVVPRDPEPFSFLATTRTVMSLVSSLAISAASLAVISRN